MRTGNIITKDATETHLGTSRWIEVYPETPREINLIGRLASKNGKPTGNVTYRSAGPFHAGQQSPLLVKVSVAVKAGIMND